MGGSLSCPFAEHDDEEASLKSVKVKSISFGDDECKTPTRSVNFNDRTMEPTILKSMGSGKMVVERSVSFKGRQLERMISLNRSLTKEDHKKDNGFVFEIDQLGSDRKMEIVRELPVLDQKIPKHEAAIKLQKVYKSFRTRRKLADCAVLVEQSWWKLLDFAELKRSSISFFDIEKHETAISRWSRARTRAAKVGKGLSKNGRAQKLALQHWLEAIDPRHRYGHNLHFYYNKWLHCQSREPFFYWLDIGEGREVNLVEKCPRWKLQQQCIKYLGPMERKAYEVVVQDGKFFYKQTGEILHTNAPEDIDSKWIFVLSTSKMLYVGKKKKGKFQHSSFLAGGATVAAGRLVIENGVLMAVWPHSGHYQPTEENFMDFLAFLQENNVDITDVRMSPTDEDDEFSIHKQRSSCMRNHSSEEDLTQGLDCVETLKRCTSRDKPVSRKEETTPETKRSTFRKLADLEIPKRVESFGRFGEGKRSVEPNPDQISEGYDSAEEDEEEILDKTDQKPKPLDSNSTGEEEKRERGMVKIPEESIRERINSKNKTKSFQLGKQLSCKWTTGAGPRIGCVRDYPSELQFQALEQVNLSPRNAVSISRHCFLPQSHPSPLWRGSSLPVDITTHHD
ncbi:PREDICTED: IQ domain-containing protein IQM2-like [Tarenaya hassleriana]|uniref:IQ domain-containing protein IQM2-like n=1 Tax=Tarenaya hassleriana TaxID=28532 RepID=UPI00053C6937|nr:PREDICTED: IQ domain-containing protein IQM2-like [Tarenaya hassleriana]